MILALSSPSATWQALFYGAAVVCFIFSLAGWWARINWLALGLALFVAIFFWVALAAS